MNRVILVLAVALAVCPSCAKWGVTDVSQRSDRRGDYSVGRRYTLQQDVFLVGSLWGEPLGAYEKIAPQEALLLFLRAPEPFSGEVPPSEAEWKKERLKDESVQIYRTCFGVVPRGASLTFVRAAEVRTVSDHYTQIIARIETGEFAGRLVDVGRISWSSKRKLCLSVDESFLKNEPNHPPPRNVGSRPSSDDSSASETPSSLGPRG